MKADGLLKLFVSEFMKLFMEMQCMETNCRGTSASYVKIMLMEARARKYNRANQNTVSMLKIGASLY